MRSDSNKYILAVFLGLAFSAFVYAGTPRCRCAYLTVPILGADDIETTKRLLDYSGIPLVIEDWFRIDCKFSEDKCAVSIRKPDSKGRDLERLLTDGMHSYYDKNCNSVLALEGGWSLGGNKFSRPIIAGLVAALNKIEEESPELIETEARGSFIYKSIRLGDVNVKCLVPSAINERCYVTIDGLFDVGE